MEMVGERFEEIQAGHEKERDIEKGWTEEDDRLIVEELGRIERFREENVVAWKSLARFVSPPLFEFLSRNERTETDDDYETVSEMERRRVVSTLSIEIGLL